MLSHDYIGTEHILLGLIREGEGVGAKALASLNVSLEAVRRRIGEIIGQGESRPAGHIPFTPRSKRTLELALREARRLNHDYIGTEHLLLGLIREGEGVAAHVLREFGASDRHVRDAVMRQLAEPAPAEAVAGGSEEKPSVFDDRERIVLTLMMEGHTKREIAEVLGVTAVEDIVDSIVRKLREAAA